MRDRTRLLSRNGIRNQVFLKNLVSSVVLFLLAGAATLALLLGLDAISAPALAGPGSCGLSIRRHRAERPALQRLTYDGRSTPWTWTPDGQSLLVKRPGQAVAGQQLFELWVLPFSADSGRQLAANALHPSLHETRVAYLQFVDRGQWEVVVIDLVDGDPVRLGAAQWNVPPRWVQGELLYLRPSGQWSSTTSSGPPSYLAPPPAQRMRARLSHDGRYVAATDGHRLWVSGTGDYTTVDQADQIWGFSWSPAQARLAYVRSDGGPMPELWVWDAESARSWPLARGGLEHLDTPAWSPDGRTLAFARRPTGNGMNATGDIWMVRAGESKGADPQPLALTPAEERAPCWSPSGRQLAFAMNGDVWVADLDVPDLSAMMATASQGTAIDVTSPETTARRAQVAPLSLTAPLTIWVMHDAAGNACRDVPDGQIDAFPLEQYVKQVVPYEVPALWPAEVLKVQSVAARTYAWRKALDRPYPAYPYTVKDSTADQYMCEETHPLTNDAVDVTQGQYVSYGGSVIYAFYCAETGDPTNYRSEFSTVPYLRPVNDPVSFGTVRRGHSWGLSQWGAYRWATWHGWDYQQMLCHYYTSAAVEPSTAITQPLASLTLPWPDFYLTTDRAYLRANAAGSASSAGGAGVLTVTFAARFTDTWTWVYTDAQASDGWGYVWPVHTYSDTFTPSIGLKVVACDGAGQAVESVVGQVGLNRTPPSGTLSISSSEVTTLTVALHLTATDPSPVSGTIQVSLGDDDWVWEDRALSQSGGEIVADSTARDGSAWHIGAGAVGALFGPGTAALPGGRPYRAYFRLKVATGALSSALELARLAVILDGEAELLGVRYVRGTDFRAGDAYQAFAVDFDYAESGGALELRVDSYGTFDLWVDRVSVGCYPIDAFPETSVPFGVNVSSDVPWTLPAREGPTTVSARYIDGAGNVSPEVALAVTVTDRSPPEGWRLFQCSGLTCTVQVRDAIAGLDTDSAAYRYSVDGELSWSGWLPAACSGAGGSHDWETIAAADVAIPLAFSEPRIQFRVYDVAAVPNEGRSQAYTLCRIYLPIIVQTVYP